MATFVAENNGGVKKKPMIILKEFIFCRFSSNKREIRDQPQPTNVKKLKYYSLMF